MPPSAEAAKVSESGKWKGKTYELELAPGEIAVIGGPWEEYRRPAAARKHLALTPTAIRRMKENILPLRCINKWTVESPITSLSLMAPECIDGKVTCDGIPLKGGEATHEFDDRYIRYSVSGAVGVHSVSVEGKADFETPLILRGDFSAKAPLAHPTEKLHTYIINGL